MKHPDFRSFRSSKNTNITQVNRILPFEITDQTWQNLTPEKWDIFSHIENIKGFSRNQIMMLLVLSGVCILTAGCASLHDNDNQINTQNRLPDTENKIVPTDQNNGSISSNNHDPQIDHLVDPPNIQYIKPDYSLLKFPTKTNKSGVLEIEEIKGQIEAAINKIYLVKSFLDDPNNQKYLSKKDFNSISKKYRKGLDKYNTEYLRVKDTPRSKEFNIFLNKLVIYYKNLDLFINDLKDQIFRQKRSKIDYSIKKENFILGKKQKKVLEDINTVKKDGEILLDKRCTNQSVSLHETLKKVNSIIKKEKKIKNTETSSFPENKDYKVSVGGSKLDPDSVILARLSPYHPGLSYLITSSQCITYHNGEIKEPKPNFVRKKNLSTCQNDPSIVIFGQKGKNILPVLPNGIPTNLSTENKVKYAFYGDDKLRKYYIIAEEDPGKIFLGYRAIANNYSALYPISKEEGQKHIPLFVSDLFKDKNTTELIEWKHKIHTTSFYSLNPLLSKVMYNDFLGDKKLEIFLNKFSYLFYKKPFSKLSYVQKLFFIPADCDGQSLKKQYLEASTGNKLSFTRCFMDANNDKEIRLKEAHAILLDDKENVIECTKGLKNTMFTEKEKHVSKEQLRKEAIFYIYKQTNQLLKVYEEACTSEMYDTVDTDIKQKIEDYQKIQVRVNKNIEIFYSDYVNNPKESCIHLYNESNVILRTLTQKERIPNGLRMWYIEMFQTFFLKLKLIKTRIPDRLRSNTVKIIGYIKKHQIDLNLPVADIVINKKPRIIEAEFEKPNNNYLVHSGLINFNQFNLPNGKNFYVIPKGKSYSFYSDTPECLGDLKDHKFKEIVTKYEDSPGIYVFLVAKNDGTRMLISNNNKSLQNIPKKEFSGIYELSEIETDKKIFWVSNKDKSRELISTDKDILGDLNGKKIKNVFNPYQIDKNKFIIKYKDRNSNKIKLLSNDKSILKNFPGVNYIKFALLEKKDRKTKFFCVKTADNQCQIVNPHSNLLGDLKDIKFKSYGLPSYADQYFEIGENKYIFVIEKSNNKKSIIANDQSVLGDIKGFESRMISNIYKISENKFIFFTIDSSGRVFIKSNDSSLLGGLKDQSFSFIDEVTTLNDSQFLFNKKTDNNKYEIVSNDSAILGPIEGKEYKQIEKIYKINSKKFIVSVQKDNNKYAFESNDPSFLGDLKDKEFDKITSAIKISHGKYIFTVTSKNKKNQIITFFVSNDRKVLGDLANLEGSSVGPLYEINGNKVFTYMIKESFIFVHVPGSNRLEAKPYKVMQLISNDKSILGNLSTKEFHKDSLRLFFNYCIHNNKIILPVKVGENYYIVSNDYMLVFTLDAMKEYNDSKFYPLSKGKYLFALSLRENNKCSLLSNDTKTNILLQDIEKNFQYVFSDIYSTYHNHRNNDYLKQRKIGVSDRYMYYFKGENEGKSEPVKDKVIWDIYLTDWLEANTLKFPELINPKGNLIYQWQILDKCLEDSNKDNIEQIQNKFREIVFAEDDFITDIHKRNVIDRYSMYILQIFYEELYKKIKGSQNKLPFKLIQTMFSSENIRTQTYSLGATNLDQSTNIGDLIRNNPGISKELRPYLEKDFLKYLNKFDDNMLRMIADPDIKFLKNSSELHKLFSLNEPLHLMNFKNIIRFSKHVYNKDLKKVVLDQLKNQKSFIEAFEDYFYKSNPNIKDKGPYLGKWGFMYNKLNRDLLFEISNIYQPNILTKISNLEKKGADLSDKEHLKLHTLYKSKEYRDRCIQILLDNMRVSLVHNLTIGNIYKYIKAELPKSDYSYTYYYGPGEDCKKLEFLQYIDSILNSNQESFQKHTRLNNKAKDILLSYHLPYMAKDKELQAKILVLVNKIKEDSKKLPGLNPLFTDKNLSHEWNKYVKLIFNKDVRIYEEISKKCLNFQLPQYKSSEIKELINNELSNHIPHTRSITLYNLKPESQKKAIQILGRIEYLWPGFVSPEHLKKEKMLSQFFNKYPEYLINEQRDLDLNQELSPILKELSNYLEVSLDDLRKEKKWYNFSTATLKSMDLLGIKPERIDYEYRIEATHEIVTDILGKLDQTDLTEFSEIADNIILFAIISFLLNTLYNFFLSNKIRTIFSNKDIDNALNKIFGDSFEEKTIKPHIYELFCSLNKKKASILEVFSKLQNIYLKAHPEIQPKIMVSMFIPFLGESQRNQGFFDTVNISGFVFGGSKRKINTAKKFLKELLKRYKKDALYNIPINLYQKHAKNISTDKTPQTPYAFDAVTAPKKAVAIVQELKDIYNSLVRQKEGDLLHSFNTHESVHTSISLQAQREGDQYDRKEYSYGDPYKDIDWKIYAKTDKFYTKLSERTDNKPVNIVIYVPSILNNKNGLLELAKKLLLIDHDHKYITSISLLWNEHTCKSVKLPKNISVMQFFEMVKHELSIFLQDKVFDPAINDKGLTFYTKTENDVLRRIINKQLFSAVLRNVPEELLRNTREGRNFLIVGLEIPEDFRQLHKENTDILWWKHLFHRNKKIRVI